MDLTNNPLWLNIAQFIIGSAVVWLCGTRLSRYVAHLATALKISSGFAGMFILGGITSLPELATTGTASLAGNASLAINNLLGSLAINVVFLALADALIGRDALTTAVARPAPMLQGTLTILLLAIVAIATVSGDIAIVGVGGFSILIACLFVLSMWLAAAHGHTLPWKAQNVLRASSQHRQPQNEDATASGPFVLLVAMKTLAVSLAILGAGYVLASSGSAIAKQTGFGEGFVGLVLLGFATGLPEISSIYGAVRQRRYEMAIGDVLGTNLWDIALIAFADALLPGDPIFNYAGPFETIATLLCVLLTSFYLVGLLERQNKTIARMGYDSVAVLISYAACLVLLWGTQGS